MDWKDGKHPVWSIVRMTVMMTFAVIILNSTATNFDSGEMKAVGGVGIASVVFDLIKRSYAPS